MPKAKPFIERLKSIRNAATIGRFFNDLARLTVILPMAEQGRIDDNDRRDLVRCHGVERDAKDPGFGWATFKVLDFKIRLAFCDGKSGTSVQYISTITFYVDGEDVTVRNGDLEALHFSILAKWKPSNLMYWMNMAWIWEARQVPAPR